MRAASHVDAERIQRQFERTGKIDLGDGRSLPCPKTEVVNIAELRPGAVDRIR